MSIIVRYPLGTILMGQRWAGHLGMAAGGPLLWARLEPLVEKETGEQGRRSRRHPRHLCPCHRQASSSWSFCMCLCQRDPWLSKLTLTLLFLVG